MRITKLVLILTSLLGASTSAQAADVFVGATSVDITPKTPVALLGQFHLRIAQEIHTPLTANIIAIESKNKEGGLDAAVFVSCDLVYIPKQITALVRDGVKKRIAGFNTNRIILSATHTHTSPVLEDSTDYTTFMYKLPSNITQVAEYRTYLVAQIVSGIIEAWNDKTKGEITWGTRRAAIPYNRRVVYADGEAKMYGNANDPNFENMEGYEDHDVHALFFWNADDELIATSIEVACPAQEVEGDTRVDADYWHPVRERLMQVYGNQLVVAGWIGAAGDQSPHPIYRKPALQRMVELSGVSRLDDIALRIVEAVERIYETVKEDRHSDLIFQHKTAILELPMRIITVAEYIESKRISHEAYVAISEDPSMVGKLNARMTWYGDIVKRFEAQKENPNPQYSTEIHVLRLGDIAICTNQFELFTDYGIQIQAQSKALQTFIIQLAGPGTYLPTAKAIGGGGYSAVCQSNSVGAEGGKILVAETLELLNEMW